MATNSNTEAVEDTGLTDVTAGKHPIGTRIRFPREVWDAANEEHPALTYAHAGETGEITGHNEWPHEGYRVKTDRWPHWFGASDTEFQLLNPPEKDLNQ